MADKFYCSSHGRRLVCDCEHPLMVHECEFGECRVEIYSKDESFCERHEADESFLARGGPINIVNTDRPTLTNWSYKLKVFFVIVVLTFVAIFGLTV